MLGEWGGLPDDWRGATAQGPQPFNLAVPWKCHTTTAAQMACLLSHLFAIFSAWQAGLVRLCVPAAIAASKGPMVSDPASLLWMTADQHRTAQSDTCSMHRANRTASNKPLIAWCLLQHSVHTAWEGTMACKPHGQGSRSVQGEVLVLEDDMLVLRMPSRALLKAAPKGWGALQLYMLGRGADILYSSPPAPWVPWQPGLFNTGSYLINREGMRRVGALVCACLSLCAWEMRACCVPGRQQAAHAWGAVTTVSCLFRD